MLARTLAAAAKLAKEELPNCGIAVKVVCHSDETTPFNVTFYHIVCLSRATPEPVHVKRRFSEFVQLHESMRSRSSQLPHLPYTLPLPKY